MPDNPQDRPNVLLISTDHWPASALGVAGHPVVKTPTIDQIAMNGTRFTNCYAECPVCVPGATHAHVRPDPAHARHASERHHDHARRPRRCPRPSETTGYQAFAVGKLHVTPQRDRIGFDEVILEEEGRVMEGVMQDDYELFLADHGHAGQRFAGGMNNNEYVWRPWHLDEHLHVTNWAAQQMSRTIKRRNPDKPGFFYLSFCHPHPPLAPLRDYLDMYRDADVPDPFHGEWSRGENASNWVKRFQSQKLHFKPDEIIAIRKAWYALCTHIDHQIRVVIGTLREEGLLNNTIIVFTADHGELLGNHGLWAKSPMFEDSTNIPMIISGTSQQSWDGPVHHHRTDDRLMGWVDVMPTLLDLCGLPIPEHCEGRSAFQENHRDYIWSECYYKAPLANRMIRSGDHKLIYYPAGNHRQLFDLANDPTELHDVIDDPAHAEVRDRLTGILIEELGKHEVDAEWVKDGELVGTEPFDYDGPSPARTFHGQRGSHLPPPKPGVVGW